MYKIITRIEEVKDAGDAKKEAAAAVFRELSKLAEQKKIKTAC